MKYYAVIAAVMLLFGQSSFASVNYEFAFTADQNSVYPSFSFSETFPDYLTAEGNYAIVPANLPDGITITQLGLVSPVGQSFSCFIFATSNAQFEPGDCGASFLPSNDPSMVGFIEFTTFPSSPGVYPSIGPPDSPISGNDLPGTIGFYDGFGTITTTITSVPEPAFCLPLSAIAGFVLLNFAEMRRRKNSRYLKKERVVL